MARKESFTADRTHPVSVFVSMLIRHRDILDLAANRDLYAASQVDHEGPTPGAVAALAEQRRWTVTRRVWTRRDIQHQQHEVGLRPWGAPRRAWRLVRFIRSREPLEVYRSARQKAKDEGDSALMGPLLKDAWGAYCEYLTAADMGEPLGNLAEGVTAQLNQAINPLMAELPPPGSDQTAGDRPRLTPTDETILAAIDEHVSVASQTDLLNKLSEDGKIMDVGTLKPRLAELKANGTLVAATPNGWGYKRP